VHHPVPVCVVQGRRNLNRAADGLRIATDMYVSDAYRGLMTESAIEAKLLKNKVVTSALRLGIGKPRELTLPLMLLPLNTSRREYMVGSTHFPSRCDQYAWAFTPRT
jgi:hypothetical protein